MSKTKYIKSKEGVGAPAPSRGKGIHAAALEWIRDHPGEFKHFAGKYAAVLLPPGLVHSKAPPLL